MTLQVIDVWGRKVIELPSQVFEAGVNHTIELNAVQLGIRNLSVSDGCDRIGKQV